MTRINCISPHLLNDKHLLAEYRELPRVFGLVRKAQNKGMSPRQYYKYNKYTLGKGHVLFFYTRLNYLYVRQQKIIAECLKRGFDIKHTDPFDLLEDIDDGWIRQWRPQPEARSLNIQRIIQRGGLRKCQT